MQRANVFIVHLWSDQGLPSALHAAVQRAGTDESAWFTDAATLVRYFEEQANVNTAVTSGAGTQEKSQQTK